MPGFAKTTRHNIFCAAFFARAYSTVVGLCSMLLGLGIAGSLAFNPGQIDGLTRLLFFNLGLLFIVVGIVCWWNVWKGVRLSERRPGEKQ